MNRTTTAEPVAGPSSHEPADDATDETVLSTSSLGCSFGSAAPVFAGIDLEIRAREVVTIVGPSGAGKTTLLRCLCGLQRPSEGTVHLNATPLTGPRDEVAVVFQDYSRSLMPWLSVRENVALPLRRTQGRAERRRSADEALAAVGLAGHEDKLPWQLSGGMQQRAAIARALAYRSRLLFMDEPFASVDAQTRANLEDLVLQVREEFDLTVVVVTHDIDEAVYLGDRVVVLGGKPTHVTDVVDVPLGRGRDQAMTKADPRFTALRLKVYKQVMGMHH